MYTSVLLLALAGFFPSTVGKEPTWLDDYSQACKQCQKVEKPLAVFIGAGSKGWNQLSRDGQLRPETLELLAKKYVCLYVDTTRKAGQELAIAFEMPNRLGVVISDSKGRVQAFRHEGELASQDLARYFRRYSDPQRIIAFTESNPTDEPAVRSYRYDNPGYVTPAYYSSFSTGRSC